jgi:hypothetical protein
MSNKDNSCNNVSPRDMVSPGNMCMDTLHKGDNDYDDDDDDDNNNNNDNVNLQRVVTGPWYACIMKARTSVSFRLSQSSVKTRVTQAVSQLDPFYCGLCVRRDCRLSISDNINK